MNQVAFRTHDDNDGDPSQQLVVGRSVDGDMWVVAHIEPGRSLRFRMPFIGGGASEHTWAALGHLMDAMEADNLGVPALHERPARGGLTETKLRALAKDERWDKTTVAQALGLDEPVDVQAMARELLLRRRKDRR